ncbi:hypothetical protein [Pseudomonas sichuanensis]|uniref:hypothetical protein n=1 Tax=Pseudomonas sichuanensis TaxID=2213015 RepID=UPI001300752D|nr:hypothetical protein [Pseudomonas sichuanensis]
MKNIEEKALYFGPGTNSTSASETGLPIPDLGLDKRFAESGVKSFEIDGVPAGNALTLIPYPAGKGSYVVSYYNYVVSGLSRKAGFTMFDEKGVVEQSFGTGGSLTIQLESRGYTVPRSTFIDAKGRLITYALSAWREGIYLKQVAYLICMDGAGRLDDAFGNQGLLNVDGLLASHFIPLNPEFEQAYCSGAVFDPYGGCYLIAFLYSKVKQASLIVRLDANGAIDKEFGNRGGVIVGNHDELSYGRMLIELVVHGARLVGVFASPGDAEWSVVRAFKLTGDVDLSYGSAGKVELEGFIARGCALHSDNSLGVLGYVQAYDPRRGAATVWAIDEAGEITKRFTTLFVPKLDSQWDAATMAGDRIYCGGSDVYRSSMLGCYRAESGELDHSFAEYGYGMPSHTSTTFSMPPTLTSRGSLLVACNRNGVAAVVAVATS